MANIVAVIVVCCFVNSCRINHFGMNPEVGGSPPKDRSVSDEMAAIVGVLDHETDNRLIDVVFRYFIVKNIDDVMIR